MALDAPPGTLALLRHPAVAAAWHHLRETDERTLRDQVELTEIPAPPFGEEARAARMVELFREASLRDVGRDAAGNALGWLPGRSQGPPLVVSAHLDTVFPEGTDVGVRRSGKRLMAPGISDDGRGLAVLVAVARAMTAARLPLEAPVLFVATVGEEGVGDLRGVKHLFGEEGAARGSRGFITLDGAGLTRIVCRGLGSVRLRLTVRGSGGHSWVDWGTPNPIHALGAAVAEMERLPLPGEPPVTLTVARWGGGTSVNAIPCEAWLEVDIRSVSAVLLASTEERVRRIAGGAVGAANARAQPGREPLTLAVERIGERPPGRTDPGANLVQAVEEATRHLGLEPELATSSTDANIPMSLGIPAVGMGAGGQAGQAHTVEEWYENERGPDGALRVLLSVLLTVGLRGG